MKTGIFVALTALAISFAALDSAAQTGEMYQYTDENGTVVFTDKKPANVDAKKTAVPAGQPPQGGNPYDTSAQQAAEPSAAQAKRDAIASDRKQRREAKAQREAQCANWQSEVDRLEPNRRHFYTDESGQTVRMDDEARVKRVAELKNQIAQNCR